MSFNLLDAVKDLLSSDLIANAGTMFGENENNMQKAVSGIIPSVLAGILNKAGSGDAGGILSMAKNAAGSGILSNIGGFLGNTDLVSKGADMLKGVFGDRMSDVANMISKFSGIKSTSAASLMSAAAPAALGALGKHAAETNMNANGLLSFLGTQKDSIMNALPSGLNLAGALGLTSLGSIGNKLTGIAGEVKDAAEKVRPKQNWLIPVLIIAAIALIWFFMRGRNHTPDTTQVTAASTDTVITAMPAAPAPAIVKVKLPDGVELDAYKGGIEDQLVNFLNDPSKQADKDTWFDFDNLNFETGSAIITPESKKQLGNIAAILKAFPKAIIKIGGYTDKTGDSLSNIKLSQTRAEAVVAALKTSGTGVSQLSAAEGYGSQFAKVSADAPDADRKKDRRIAVSVRKK
ncbi:MAG: OmpA family protein [Chitinophagaceae bacterium]